MPSLSLDFLAGLAHELRTPLGAIGGYAELMELGVHGPVTPAQVDGLRRIRRNQELMVSLIGAFMTYAEAVTGGTELNARSVELFPALEKAVDEIAARAHEKAIHVVIERPTVAETVVVSADAEALDTVIAELLLDAVESTPPKGEVHVAVEAGSGSVTLRVMSTGDPIPDGSHEAVFIPFDREGKGNRISASPHALSLPIARALARAMGGDVLASPNPLMRSLALELRRLH